MEPSEKIKIFNKIYDFITQNCLSDDFSITCKLLEDYQVVSGESLMMLAEEDLYSFKEFIHKIKLNGKAALNEMVKNLVEEYLTEISRYSVLEKSEKLETYVTNLSIDNKTIKEQLDKAFSNNELGEMYWLKPNLDRMKEIIETSKKRLDMISEINIANISSDILELQVKNSRLKKEVNRLKEENELLKKLLNTGKKIE